MNSQRIIKLLNLEPHPLEGGYFKRTYESPFRVQDPHNERKTLSSIYYLLTRDHSIGFLHRNRSDILHYYHLGNPLKYLLVLPDGQIKETILGPDLEKGHVLQLLVRGGIWKATQLLSDNTSIDFGLISEAVSPGFDYADNEVASLAHFQRHFPRLIPELLPYIKA